MIFLMLSLTAAASGTEQICFHCGGVCYTLEKAITDDEFATGLMNRSNIIGSDGMIFIISNPYPIRMWMKNTKIPLDMIFLNSGGEVIYIRSNTVPYSLEKIGPDADTAYVIELKAGRVEEGRIKIGNIMTVGGTR